MNSRPKQPKYARNKNQYLFRLYSQIIAGKVELMIIRTIEIIFIKTDQTWIGENILHKICCILLIWIALDMLRLHWSDLGFSKKGYLLV